MIALAWLQSLTPLLAAVALGGMVGWDRERAGRPAGLRTHILVAVGSALIMQTSVLMWDVFAGSGQAADPGRIAAQVVNGIGFLGAGTIMREGLAIRGLTTAASLWMVSALGLAAGAGMYVAAVSAGLVAFAALHFLPLVERRYLGKHGSRTITVRVEDAPGQLGLVAARLEQRGLGVVGLQIRPDRLAGLVEIAFSVNLVAGADVEAAVVDLMRLPGVMAVQQDDR